jgi:hypothetical protein
VTVRTTIVLAASLLGLSFVTPAAAQRASCSQLAGLIESEQALEGEARLEQRRFLGQFGTPYGGIVETAGGFPGLKPHHSRALQFINARVRRHSGNVQRLQGRYAKLGCEQTQQQAARPASGDPAAAAALTTGILGMGMGIGSLMGGGGPGFAPSGGRPVYSGRAPSPSYGSYGRTRRY